VKNQFFGSFVLEQLGSLYSGVCARSEVDSSASTHSSVATMLEAFLTTICCSNRPGVGIRYPDPNWNVLRASGSKPRNMPMLRMALKLKAADDTQQQKLVLRVLSVCPELIEGYLNAVSYSLEPRLSLRWIQNIAFAMKVFAIPHPPFLSTSSILSSNNSSFATSSSSSTMPTLLPTDVTFLADHILPPLLSRSHLSHGLQHSSKLVKYQTTLALTVAFQKMEVILRDGATALKLRKDLFVVPSLSEEEESGDEDQGSSSSSSSVKEQVVFEENSQITSSWLTFIESLKDSIRKRVPDLQTVIAQCTQLLTTLSPLKKAGGKAQETSEDQVQVKLMAEASLRLFHFYQKYLPEVVAESQFDFGKLLAGRELSSLPSPIQYQIVQLLLFANDVQFKWMAHGSHLENLLKVRE
jgi:nucleolar pre-ribosomal-associated protein 1